MVSRPLVPSADVLLITGAQSRNVRRPHGVGHQPDIVEHALRNQVSFAFLTYFLSKPIVCDIDMCRTGP